MWLLFACAEPAPAPPPAPAAAPAATPAATPVATPPVATPAASPAAAPAATGVRVVFLGDSLTAGMGLPGDEAFPALLGKTWKEAGIPVEIVNAGVSGDTTAGGLRRVTWLLSQRPDVLVVALGANDMLRGLPAAEAEANLRGIVQQAKAAGASVVLLGMKANPTLGPEYVAAFDAIYPRVAADEATPLVPFFLEGVGGVASLNQADGLHPTAEGHARIAALVEPALGAAVRARQALLSPPPPR